MEWIRRHRSAAGVSAGDDPAAHLEVIEPWQRRARAAAEKAPRHGNKVAVQTVPPGDAASEALYSLYAIWAEDIYWTCRQVHQRWMASAHADEPGVSFEDVLQESWVLYQRAMVQAEGRYQMLDRLQARTATYLRSRLVTPEDPDRGGLPARGAPLQIDMLAVGDEVAREVGLQQVWQRLRPDLSEHAQE